jgi:arginyl-tRNA synthetase
MKKEVVGAIYKAINRSLPPNVIGKSLEVPPDPKLGDYAFPCFLLAKKLNQKPNKIAKNIAKKISAFEFEKVEAVGPYVNFSVNRDMLTQSIIDKIRKEREKYGSFKDKKEKVMVEFSQANTHKAFHIGHIRGTSLGESIARILEFAGNKVTRANYQGDTGMHVAKWIWCYNKYHKKEKLRKNEAWLTGIYVDAVRRLVKNEKLQKQVDKINSLLDSKEDEKLNKLWEKTRKLSLDALEEIYKQLNTKFDEYFFESQMEQRGKIIAKELVEKEIAEISDEAVIVNLEKYNLGIWVLLRKDGTALYSTKDLALAEKKFKEHKIDTSIYVVGSEQKLHLYQLFKTLELMKFKQAEKCKYVPVSLVRLPWGKMSSRTGENILYSAFMKELTDYASKEIEKRHKLKKEALEKRALAIAIASLKYSMLKQDARKTFVFRKEEALKFEGDTGPYLLYTYARAKNILKKAKYKERSKYALDRIAVDDSEKNLISQLGLFPEVVSQACQKLSPNSIANYAYQIAKLFNEFYHSAKVIGSEKERFRLILVDSFAQVLKNSLFLLGITVIERM